MKKSTRGFTIAELLIVIVVIAILASISIVAHTGIQNNANDSVVASDAAAIAKKLELEKIEKGRYPVLHGEFPGDLRITKRAYQTTTNNALYCVNRITDNYALFLVSKSGKGYLVVSGDVRQGVAVNHSAMGVQTCSAVGATWANDVANGAIHGHHITNSWHPNWTLVRD